MLNFKQVQTYLKESKSIAKEMGQEKDVKFIFSTFEALSELKESECKNILHDYLFKKFIKSGASNNL